MLLLSSPIWYENALCLEIQISHLKNTYFLYWRSSTLYSFPSLVAAFKGNCVLSIHTVQGTVLHKRNGRNRSKVYKTALYSPRSSAYFFGLTAQGLVNVYDQNALKLPYPHYICLSLCSTMNLEGCNFNPTLENILYIFPPFLWPPDLMVTIHGHRATNSFTKLASLL